MTDDLQKLESAFRDGADIAPREGAKRLAISQAMAAYDENFKSQSQGMRAAGRLSAAYETLIGRWPMFKPALMATGTLAAVIIAVPSAFILYQILVHGHFCPGGCASIDQIESLRALDAPSGAAPFGKVARGRRSAALEQPQQVSKNKLAKPREAESQPARETGVLGMFGGARGHRSDTAADPRIGALAPPAHDQIVPVDRYQGRDQFEDIATNPIKVVKEDPVSTFAIDVDTASYGFVRASLNQGVLPQKNAVRVEELINYFAYDYPRPADKSVPFEATLSVLPAPWNKDNKLVHIAIAGYDIEPAEKPRSNLVLLIDVSGSMSSQNKLPLLKNSMKLLLDGLEPEDTIGIVTYAGRAGAVLEPTPVKEKQKILGALESLGSGGSTAGGEGIRQAYRLAEQNFDKQSVNRVILATDGDFNVGITDREELKSFIERKRDTGIYLSVLGFGMGNYNDALMQTLAQNGNGNAAYIDSLNEARKVLVEEASSTLFPIAKDVKIQVEFNPKTVAEYRLIGYETRALKREDFKNDKVDAGEIGSGHRVTAIYEIAPVGSGSRLVGDLRYQASESGSGASAPKGEYGFVKIRYKLPGEAKSKLITAPITPGMVHESVAAAPQEVRFATSIAAFGQLLRGGQYTGDYGYDDVIALAQNAKGKDEFGYRAEFINLARLAKSASALEPLTSQQPGSGPGRVRN